MNRDICKKCRFAYFFRSLDLSTTEMCLGAVKGIHKIDKSTLVPMECAFALEQLMSGEKVRGT